MTRTAVLFLFVLINYVNCYLIKTTEGIETKDYPVLWEDLDNNDLKLASPQGIEADVLLPVVDPNESKKCAKIGEFVSIFYVQFLNNYLADGTKIIFFQTICISRCIPHNFSNPFNYYFYLSALSYMINNT